VIEAYVLIQTEIGRTLQVAAAMIDIPGVDSAAVVTGPYDVVARVAATDVDSLGKLTVGGIQAVDGVNRTLTCPIVHL